MRKMFLTIFCVFFNIELIMLQEIVEAPKLSDEIVIRRELNDNYFFNRNQSNELNSSKVIARKHLIDYRKAYHLRYNPDFLLKYPTKHPKNSSNEQVLADNVIESASSNDVYENVRPSATSEMIEFEQKNQFNIDFNETIPPPVHRFQTMVDDVRDRLLKLFVLGQNASTREHLIIREAFSPHSKRLLNLFTVIQIENAPCSTKLYPMRQMQGTCYIKSQCAEFGGTEMGSCAAGFGVCCVCK